MLIFDNGDDDDDDDDDDDERDDDKYGLMNAPSSLVPKSWTLLAACFSKVVRQLRIPDTRRTLRIAIHRGLFGCIEIVHRCIWKEHIAGPLRC